MEQKRNNKYVALDYFRQLREKAYGETESFDEFVERIAEEYFPGRGKEWCQHYAFSLHFYGLCVAACKECTGTCPHHGHKYHLRIKRGSSVPIPWASSELCPKFKDSVDRHGRKCTRQEFVEAEQTESDFDFPMELLEDMQEQSEQGSGWPNIRAKNQSTRKVEQQYLFETE